MLRRFPRGLPLPQRFDSATGRLAGHTASAGHVRQGDDEPQKEEQEEEKEQPKEEHEQHCRLSFAQMLTVDVAPPAQQQHARSEVFSPDLTGFQFISRSVRNMDEAAAFVAVAASARRLDDLVGEILDALRELDESDMASDSVWSLGSLSGATLSSCDDYDYHDNGGGDVQMEGTEGDRDWRLDSLLATFSEIAQDACAQAENLRKFSSMNQSLAAEMAEMSEGEELQRRKLLLARVEQALAGRLEALFGPVPVGNDTARQARLADLQRVLDADSLSSSWPMIIASLAQQGSYRDAGATENATANAITSTSERLQLQIASSTSPNVSLVDGPISLTSPLPDASVSAAHDEEMNDSRGRNEESAPTVNSKVEQMAFDGDLGSTRTVSGDAHVSFEVERMVNSNSGVGVSVGAGSGRANSEPGLLHGSASASAARAENEENSKVTAVEIAEPCRVHPNSPELRAFSQSREATPREADPRQILSQ